MVSFIPGAAGLRRGLSSRPALGSDPAALTRVRLRLALPAAVIRPAETTLTAAPWRLSAGTAAAPGGADADLTAKLAADDSQHVGFSGGGAKLVTILETARQFPVTTLADSGTAGNLQNGTSAALWTAALRTDSPRIALRVDGGYPVLSRLRFMVDGRLVTLPEPAAIGGGRRWLVLEPGPGLHVIQMQGAGDSAWGGCAVLPGASVTPVAPNARALVLGDSLTVGGGAGQLQWDSWPAVMGRTAGIDDIWLSGSGGTGYLAGGTAKTLPARAAQDVARFAAAGPADLILLAGGLNDLTLGDVGAAVTATLAAVRAAAPDALIAVLTPYDTAAPAAPVAGHAARRAEIMAAAARADGGRGVAVIDLQGLAYEKSDASHASAAGAAVIAAHVAAALQAILRS